MAQIPGQLLAVTAASVGQGRSRSTKREKAEWSTVNLDVWRRKSLASHWTKEMAEERTLETSIRGIEMIVAPSIRRRLTNPQLSNQPCITVDGPTLRCNPFWDISRTLSTSQARRHLVRPRTQQIVSPLTNICLPCHPTRLPWATIHFTPPCVGQ